MSKSLLQLRDSARSRAERYLEDNKVPTGSRSMGHLMHLFEELAKRGQMTEVCGEILHEKVCVLGSILVNHDEDFFSWDKAIEYKNFLASENDLVVRLAKEEGHLPEGLEDDGSMEFSNKFAQLLARAEAN